MRIGSDNIIIGHHNLKQLFQNFTDDIAENGIDLRVGKVKQIVQDDKEIGCVNDKKLVPNYFIIEPSNNQYKLLPKNFYFIEVDRPIHIPKGYCQFYFLRSTFSRCGLILTDAVGDDNFEGTLMLGIYNSSPKPISIGANERIIQAVTIRNDDTATSYEGDYQNNKIYN